MAIKEGFISNIIRMSKRILMKFEQIFLRCELCVLAFVSEVKESNCQYRLAHD